MKEERKNNLRDGIGDADDTKLVAGEELITEAETLLPLLRREAALPHADLHGALAHGHAAHATIDELHAEMQGDSPNPHAIQRHVAHLRTIPELEAMVANWWESPRTQRFFGILAQIGA